MLTPNELVFMAGTGLKMLQFIVLLMTIVFVQRMKNDNVPMEQIA